MPDLVPLAIQEQYIKRARELGIDVRDTNQVRQLLSSIRYCQLKFAPGPRRSERAIADELGVHETTIDEWRRKGYVGVASEIVLAQILDPDSMRDIRHELMVTLTQGIVPALRNIVRIAAGRPVEEGGHVPMDRDAVNAFSVISESKIADAYLTMMFRGNLDLEDDGETLARAQKLLGETTPLNLDVIEADPIPVGNEDQLVAGNEVSPEGPGLP